MTRRLSSAELQAHRNVQSVAKAVLAELPAFITPEATELSLARKARELLAQRGAEEAWYHGVHAIVLLGGRSCLSVSGKAYRPATERVGLENLVTVDLSPEIGGVWGDCARSYAVMDGTVTTNPSAPAIRAGMDFVLRLHREMRASVTPSTTFHDLHEFGNASIQGNGYENLDFRGNLGHSIARDLKARLFIERGNRTALGEVPLFTFEPHVRARDGRWGFKHENIYYFDDLGCVQEL